MSPINRYLAIIPARGGSKRLPKKNILKLAGKPLIAWSIEAALRSRAINRVLVTSDDDEILTISKCYGADVLKRPDALAQDTSTSLDAIKHAIENSHSYEYIVLLQPTSPLRTYQHIDEAIEFLEEKKADAVISVAEVEHSPLWMNVLPADNSMTGFLRENVLNCRSQDLPAYYRLNGAIYICRTEKLLEQNSFFLESNIYAYKMNTKSSVDIDSEFDFKLAEFLMA